MSASGENGPTPHAESDQLLESAATYFRAGEYAKSEAILRGLAKRADDNAEAQNLLGYVYQTTGRIEAAIGAFRKTVSLRPDAPGAYNNLAAALAQAGQLEEAVRQYDCALRLAPAVAAIYANKAAALSALGRAAEAIVALERALSHDPSYGNADRQLASLLSKSAATGYSPTIETALQRCFDSPRVDYVALARPAAQQILSKYGLE